MTRLAIGKSLTRVVDPRPLFVPTGIDILPGERYRLEARGLWKDDNIVSDAEGWLGWKRSLGYLAAPLARVPMASVFQLCGSIGPDDRLAFPISPNMEWTVPSPLPEPDEYRLYLFANDWHGHYGNNHAMPADEGGPLSVTITRLG